MFKKINALLLTSVMLLSSLVFPALAADTSNGYAPGIVSLYDGVRNTRSGHKPDSGVWEDLVGNNDIQITADADNHFTDEGFHLKSSKQYFPKAIVDLVNGSEFTVEMYLGSLKSLGTEFNTFINSSNDNFSLFRRLTTDVLEFKFAGNPATKRPTVAGALDLVPESLISITYKVGGKTIIYVNGKKAAEAASPSAMGANDLFFGHSDPSRNYETTFRSLRFYDRALTADEILLNARNDEVAYNSDFVTIAQPSTNVVGDIALARRVNSAEELDAVAAAANKPSSAILRLNTSAEIVGTNGKKFCTIADFMKKTEYKILPVFETDDENAVPALAEALSKLKFHDCAIMSKNTSVVRNARNEMPQIRGIVDFTETYANKTGLTAADITSIRKAVKENLAHVALLPLCAARKEAVQALYDGVVNVWVDVPEEPSDTVLYDALLSGALGVVSDATDSLLEKAKQLPQKTMTRVPLNIGHRGLPASYPENTLESAIAAYEAGADVVELDIYLTTANEIVIMHDANTGRTCNRNVDVEKSSLEQLKKLYVNKGYENVEGKNKCTIPTLREYFEYFKDTDCRFFIEIKSANPRIVPLMAEMIEEYGLYDRCGVISFDMNQLKETGIQYPEMSLGFLCGNLMDENESDADMKTVMAQTGKLNATLNPSYSGYGTKAARAALLRGIGVYPWTFDGTAYNNYMLWGYSGLTGNNAVTMGGYLRSLTVACDTEARVGDTVTLLPEAVAYDRSAVDVNPAFVVLEGNDIGKIEGNRITFTGEGTFTFFATAENAKTIRYSLATQPITINVKAAEAVPETEAPRVTEAEETDEEDTKTSSAAYLGVPLGVLVLVLIIMGLSKVTPKHD
ncbi:MAG: hypothetical protein MJ070_06190 [Lachnospiraceae bacterium]|nr:hypothetical protein [Lachnospiraceae bacterium]